MVSSIYSFSFCNNKVKVDEVKQRGGSGLLAYYGGSLLESLVSLYPQFPWESSRHWRWTNAIQTTSKSQTKLFNEIKVTIYFNCSFLKKKKKELLPNIKDIFLNYQLRARNVDTVIELDIFIPSISLAFEYQVCTVFSLNEKGKQHYEENLVYSSLQQQQLTDSRKEKICKEEGILLVKVPYYWDGEKSSLRRFIKELYPEVEDLS